jgi:hypothetical protein
MPSISFLTRVNASAPYDPDAATVHRSTENRAGYLRPDRIDRFLIEQYYLVLMAFHITISMKTIFIVCPQSTGRSNHVDTARSDRSLSGKLARTTYR